VNRAAVNAIGAHATAIAQSAAQSRYTLVGMQSGGIFFPCPPAPPWGAAAPAVTNDPGQTANADSGRGLGGGPGCLLEE